MIWNSAWEGTSSGGTKPMTELSRILACAIGFFGLFAAPASAADVPVKAPATPAAIVMNWSGGYLGLHWGFMWTRHSAVFPGGNPALQIVGVPGLGFDTDENTGIGGFLAANSRTDAVC